MVVDPANGLHRICDVLIHDGIIAAVGEGLAATEDCQIINASDLVVMPGLIDMHVHLRDPGLTHKEDVFTGCEAAAAGGVTSLLCMPNTKPSLDNVQTVTELLTRAARAKAHVYVTGAISTGLSGAQLTDFSALKQAGVIAVSDDGRPVENAAMMAHALVQAHETGLLVTSHCEDLSIVDGGIINEGIVSRALGVKGMHRSSEDMITAREIILAETYGVSVHIAHISTAGAVQLIREAKARGVAVTAETCPHYFSMTEQVLLQKDADYRMNPPLRTEEDRAAILAGLSDGTIDCIVTDHAPHTPEEKADFYQAPCGVIGMETSFAASITELVKTGRLSLPELVCKMSWNPAKILGIHAGTLSVGAPADIALADIHKTWVVDPQKSHSKARNMIYKGQTLTGQVMRTLMNGETVYTDPTLPPL